MFLPAWLSLFESGLQHQPNSFLWSSFCEPSSLQCRIENSDIEYQSLLRVEISKKMLAVGFCVTAKTTHKTTHVISYGNTSCLKLKYELSLLNCWSVMFTDCCAIEHRRLRSAGLCQENAIVSDDSWTLS